MRRSPLKRQTGFLRRVSESQRVRNAEWRRVSRLRAESVNYRCEAAIAGVCDGWGLHGHHVIRWVHDNPAKSYALGLLERSAAGRQSADPPAKVVTEGASVPPFRALDDLRPAATPAPTGGPPAPADAAVPDGFPPPAGTSEAAVGAAPFSLTLVTEDPVEWGRKVGIDFLGEAS